MGRVANEDDLLVVFSLTGDSGKVQPCGATEVRGVALKAMAVQVAAEEPLAESDRLLGVIPIQTVSQPGLLPGLDDDGREVLAELVGMDLEPAVLRTLKSEGKGQEGLGSSQPDKPAFALVDIGLEHVYVAVTGAAVAPVRRDNEIGVRKGVIVLDLVPEALLHAQLVGALLKDLQLFFPADSAEAMASADEFVVVFFVCFFV